MPSSARMDLRLEEPGDDPLSDQIFDILRDALQPDSELPIETAEQRIGALLPEGEPYTREVGTFLETCYEVADQIPYSHPSMTKLTTLLYSTLNSVWQQSQVNKAGENAQDTPYQKLVETLRDWWNSSRPAEDPEKFVNFQTFTGHLHERGMIKGNHLAVWTIQDALDGAKSVPQRDRNAYVKAAANWLLLNGKAVYAEVAGDQEGRKEWRGWQDRFSEVVDGKWNGRPCAYDEDAMILAGRASVSMDAIQRLQTG